MPELVRLQLLLQNRRAKGFNLWETNRMPLMRIDEQFLVKKEFTIDLGNSARPAAAALRFVSLFHVPPRFNRSP
jgi:hypothetical protein